MLSNNQMQKTGDSRIALAITPSPLLIWSVGRTLAAVEIAGIRNMQRPCITRRGSVPRSILLTSSSPVASALAIAHHHPPAEIMPRKEFLARVGCMMMLDDVTHASRVTR
jgi:hypothetical protein